MTNSTDAVTTAARQLGRLGYDTEHTDVGGAPAAVATPGPDAEDVLTDRRRHRGSPRAVALEPVDADADPVELVDAVAHAIRNDRLCLFLTRTDNGRDPDAAVNRVRDVLTDPVAAADVTDGNRTFYHLPNRIRLAEGGLALYRTDGPITDTPPAPTWHEETPEEDDSGRTGTDRKRLVFADGDRTVAVLDSAGELACPGPSRSDFPFSYHRGEDKRFHVRSRSGREVGTFTGVRAMRRSGFRPVPEPLVPEFAFERSPTDAWAVLGPDGRLVTARGNKTLDRD